MQIDLDSDMDVFQNAKMNVLGHFFGGLLILLNGFLTVGAQR